MARLYCFGTLVTEEEGWLITSEVNHHFLKDDGRMQGTEGQRVYFLRFLQRQFNNLLHHTTGNGRVIDAINVLWLLIQVGIEVYSDRLTTVKGNVIAEASDVEIVEGGLDDDVNLGG